MSLPDSRDDVSRQEDDEPEGDEWEEEHTPRTLKVCDMEGIRPQDLAYIPMEWFQLPGVSKKFARVRHDYFDARRQDLLEVVARTRQKLIAGDHIAAGPMSPRGPDDMQAQYKNSLEFFREQYATINMSNIVPQKDWTAAKKTMPEVEIPYVPMDAAANKLPKLSSPSGRGSNMRKSRSSPSMTASSSKGSLGTTWKSIEAENKLNHMFKTLGSAPGAGWMEHEGIKRTQNNLFALREINLRKQTERHERNTTLGKKRNAASHGQFESLMQELDEQHENKLHKEKMLPPKFYNHHDRHCVENSRLNRLDFLATREQFTQNCMTERIAKDQALEKYREEEAALIKMKFAQLTLKDRIRWRHQYEDELQRRDKFRVGLVTTFCQNEARAELKAQQVKDNSAFKHELEKLRATHRQLCEFQRIRKENYEEAERVKALREAGERRMATSMVAARKFAESMGLQMLPPAPSVG